MCTCLTAIPGSCRFDTWVLQVRGADRFLQFEAQQVESEAGWAALQGGDEKVQDVDSCFMTDSG